MGVYDTQRKPVDLIVLHHTVTAENATWKDLSNIGKTRTYAGYPHSDHFDPETGEETFVAYHFIVYKDGTYRRCLPDDAIGWHCGNWEKNTRSIAISCVGNYVDQDPTGVQLETIANIIRPYDRARGGDLTILGHREIASTACPGRILNHRQAIIDKVNIDPTQPLPDRKWSQTDVYRDLIQYMTVTTAGEDTVEQIAKNDVSFKAMCENLWNDHNFWARVDLARPCNAKELQKQLEAEVAQNDALSRQNETLLAELSDITEEYQKAAKIAGTATKLEARLETTTNSLKDANARIAVHERQLAKRDREIDELNAKIIEQNIPADAIQQKPIVERIIDFLKLLGVNK